MGKKPSYSCIRRVRLGSQVYSLGVNCHHNSQLTNEVKVWDRYAGCLVIRGRGTYLDWEGRLLEVGPGDFVHHHPGLYHHIERDATGWDEFSLIFDETLYTRFHALGLIDSGRGVVRIALTQSLILAFDRLHEGLEGAVEADGGRLILEAGALLRRTLEGGERSAPATSHEALLDAARRQLAEDCHLPLSLENLARESGMSYPSFRRLFRERFGVSPGAYRNHQRMEQAALLLQYSRQRVAEVAKRLGYSDPFIFSRQFRKHFGVSPKRYSVEHRRD